MELLLVLWSPYSNDGVFTCIMEFLLPLLIISRLISAVSFKIMRKVHRLLEPPLRHKCIDIICQQYVLSIICIDIICDIMCNVILLCYRTKSNFVMLSAVNKPLSRKWIRDDSADPPGSSEGANWAKDVETAKLNSLNQQRRWKTFVWVNLLHKGWANKMKRGREISLSKGKTFSPLFSL